MKTKQLLAGIAAGSMLAGSTLALAAPAGAATAPACPNEAWPASADGRPAAHTDAEGVYLWHTATGWRLRVNEPGADRAVFTGSIKVDGRLVSWGRHLERGGEGVVTRSGAGVAGFRFVNRGGVDGLDFVTQCSSTLTVRVRMNGAVVDADHVFVGADGHHPSSLPTTITKAA